MKTLHQSNQCNFGTLNNSKTRRGKPKGIVESCKISKPRILMSFKLSKPFLNSQAAPYP